MAALAEWPERLLKVFKNHEYPAEGGFAFTFFKQGKEIEIVIDDRLPYKEREYVSGNSGSYYPANFVNTRKSDNDAYWGVLLEKAAAKYYGNYERMEGGNT